MGANLEITNKLQNYINNFGLKLHPVQQEIIDYNNTLGDIKRISNYNTFNAVFVNYLL